MKPFVFAAAGLVMAAAFCAGTPKGAVIVSNMGIAAAQDDSQAFTMRPLRLADPPAIDGLKLIETAGQPTLLYSTQAAPEEGRYELVIHAAPVGNPTAATEVARIGRMLPPAPRWDARPAGRGYEILYEMVGGAIDAILFQDVRGTTTRVSVEHPFESFSRPHFVRMGMDAGTSDVGAVADLKKVVVFPGGTTQPVKYTALVDGADAIVGGTTNRWVVAKSVMSGDALFDTLPGRLTLSRAGRSIPFPDLLVYELDATGLGNDVVVFATSKPAVLLLGGRPDQPYRFTAEDRGWLLRLSKPTILVTAQFVHVAAIVSPQTGQAMIVYGAVPIAALGR